MSSTRRGSRPFANPDVHLRSWYPTVPSRRVRKGRVLTHPFLGRRLALYRSRTGDLHALDARCPHMGANLGDGEVRDDRLVCPFHHWEFDGGGRCVARPSGAPPSSGRWTFSYPIRERFGFVWVFNGPEPTFPLPSAPGEGEHLLLRPPGWTLGCHHHVIVSNGIDLNHWRCVHGFVPYTAPEVERLPAGGFRVSLHLEAREDRPIFRLAGATRLDGVYTIHGGNIAVIDAERPWRFRAILAHRPCGDGGTRSRLFGLFPKGGGAAHWLGLEAAAALAKLALLGLLLSDDRAILDRIDFWPRLTREDSVLAAFVQQVNGMEGFEPSREATPTAVTGPASQRGAKRPAAGEGATHGRG